MGINARARAAWRRTADRPVNTSLEDRLLRGCLALSLVLLAVFTIAFSSRIGAAGVTFTVAALYCVLTAALGWDPVYRRLGIDTYAARPVDPLPRATRGATPRAGHVRADAQPDESFLHLSATSDRSA